MPIKKTKKPEKVRESYAEIYQKESNPLDTNMFLNLINAGRISGYLKKSGTLSNGKGFAEVYIIIEHEQFDL